ncbi:MAG: HdeD family acid-resistance protein [Armatimonadota bacterium]
MALGFNPDIQSVAKNWWSLALRGLAAIAFGVIAFAWPGLTVALLVIFFGAFVLVDGVFAIVGSFIFKGGISKWWVLLVEGLIGVVIGIIVFVRPDFAAAFLVVLIAVWAMVTGVLELAAAVTLRKVLPDIWLLVIMGLLSLVFGILLISQPLAGAIALIWIIAVYAIFFGVMLIALAFTLKGMIKPEK